MNIDCRTGNVEMKLTVFHKISLKNGRIVYTLGKPIVGKQQQPGLI
jgi:hypothetical protein